MSTFVIHPNSADPQAGHLVDLLAEQGHKAAIARTFSQVREHSGYGGGRSFIFVPDSSGDPSLADEAIRFAEVESRDAFVIYVSDAMSADAYKRLVRANAGEWIRWDALSREIADVFRSGKEARQEGVRDGATIVSFLPSKGGVGNTTLALETGVYLASGKKRNASRVAVLDLNFQNSTLADLLDLEPRFDIAEIMDRPERLDSQLIDIFSNKHSTSIDIFASPPSLVPSQNIQPEVIFALLDELGKKYNFVLLDLPNHRHPWLDNVLQGSSAVTVTGEATVPSIKQIANKQKYLDDLGISGESAAVIVNACQTNLFGRVSRKAEIDRTFAGRRIFYVRRDIASVTEAANTGRPMMQAAPNRAIARNIRRVGDWLQSIAAASAKHPAAAARR